MYRSRRMRTRSTRFPIHPRASTSCRPRRAAAEVLRRDPGEPAGSSPWRCHHRTRGALRFEVGESRVRSRWKLTAENSVWSRADLSTLRSLAVEQMELDPDTAALHCRLSDDSLLEIRPLNREADDDPPSWRIGEAPFGMALKHGPGLLVDWEALKIPPPEGSGGAHPGETDPASRPEARQPGGRGVHKNRIWLAKPPQQKTPRRGGGALLGLLQGGEICISIYVDPWEVGEPCCCRGRLCGKQRGPYVRRGTQPRSLLVLPFIGSPWNP